MNSQGTENSVKIIEVLDSVPITLYSQQAAKKEETLSGSYTLQQGYVNSSQLDSGKNSYSEVNYYITWMQSLAQISFNQGICVTNVPNATSL